MPGQPLSEEANPGFRGPGMNPGHVRSPSRRDPPVLVFRFSSCMTVAALTTLHHTADWRGLMGANPMPCPVDLGWRLFRDTNRSGIAIMHVSGRLGSRSALGQKTRNSQTSTNKNGQLADNLLVSVVWAVAKLSEPFLLGLTDPQSRRPRHCRLAIVLVMAVNSRADINGMDLVSA